MNKLSWRVRLGVALVAATAVLMVVHYLIFHDLHHLAIFSVHEIAMMPLEVLVVTMILHSLLARREREEMRNKLNMVIGAFFSEVGDELLRRVTYDSSEEIREHMLVDQQWDARRYAQASRAIATHNFHLELSPDELASLREFIVSRRPFLLGLLQNPTLLEHESFTNVLWAVFHLAEELEHRDDFASLPESDVRHLAGDVKRAYAATAAAWLDHMQHLQKQYPYLFSLAVRTNPLDSSASVIVAE